MLAMMHPDQKIARCRNPVHGLVGHSRSIITIGKLAINLDARRVTLGSSRVDVTGSEYRMLELLALRRGHCVTRTAFMDYLYGAENAPKPKILDVFVCKLRSKLSAADGVDIETVWGRGYRLNDAVGETNSAIELRRWNNS